MKAIGCAAVVIVVLVGGFLALVTFVLGRGEDQSALTQRTELVISDAKRVQSANAGTRYRFELAYEVDGEWFGDSDAIDEDRWNPDLALTACVNPDDPRQYVVNLREDRCGQESISGGTIREAEPTSAPDRADQEKASQ